MEYIHNIIFPINFFQKFHKLGNVQNFIKIDRRYGYFFNLVFDEVKYVVMEIGVGRGDFIINYAQDNPDYCIIGIEKSENLVKEVARRLENKGLTNVRLICSKAEFATYFIIPDDFLNEVIINFPDPWPKKAHIRRRLVNKNFLALLYKKMRKHGKIMISTDVENYKDFILENLKSLINQNYAYRIEKVSLGFWSKYQTKYLRKWSNLNRKIYSIEITRE